MKPARVDVVPARALFHPIYFGALALLVLNDHFFKGSGLLPGWLTGKLSDFAGLFVAVPLLAWILRARTRQAVLVANVVVGFGYAALELSPELTRAADALYGLAGFSWKSVSDPTDLLALFVLPLAQVFTVTVGRAPRRSIRRVAELGLVFSALFACAASTGAKVTQQGPCAGPDCDSDGYDAPEDCNDYDATLYPGEGCPNLSGEKVCDDLVDDDGDHLIDCDDPDCALACVDIEGACAAGTRHDFELAELLMGSTLTGTSVTDGSCAGADSPEAIFQGEVQHAGVLSITIPAGHAVHVRRDCIDRYTELACSVASGDTLDVTLGEPGPVTIVVEALDPLAPSDFELPLTFRPLHCGDGVRIDPEECDDGNLVSGDGCSATCTAEYDVLCAGLAVATLGSNEGSFVGSTAAFAGPCGGSLDRVERGFHYTPTTGTVIFDATSDADVMLYVTSGCGGAAPSRGCVDATVAGGAETLTVHPVPGEELTVFLELADGAPLDSTYTLQITEP